MRYKLAFDVEAETLFAIFAKLLPIENLTVQELEPPARGNGHAPPPPRLVKPKPARGRPGARGGPDLTAGVNKAIVEALAGGPRRAVELKRAIGAAGYAPSGIGSRLDSLRGQGIVERLGGGMYRLAEKP